MLAGNDGNVGIDGNVAVCVCMCLNRPVYRLLKEQNKDLPSSKWTYIGLYISHICSIEKETAWNRRNEQLSKILLASSSGEKKASTKLQCRGTTSHNSQEMYQPLPTPALTKNGPTGRCGNPRAILPSCIVLASEAPFLRTSLISLEFSVNCQWIGSWLPPDLHLNLASLSALSHFKFLDDPLVI